MKHVKRTVYWRDHGYELRSNYSWVAINHETKKICYTGWAHHTKDGETLILSVDWQTDIKGRKKANYGPALEALDLISKGYTLQIIPCYMANVKEMENGEASAAKTAGALPKFIDCELVKRGGLWFAVHGEELPPPDQWRPRKPRLIPREDARQMMADYYRENKDMLPNDIGKYREEIIDRIVNGSPLAEAFKI